MAPVPVVRALSGWTQARRGFSVPPWFRARWLRRALRVLLSTPLTIRIVVFTVAIVMVWAAVNWAYHVIRKPTELFSLVNGTFAKTPPETWRQYAPLFRRDSTATITPELLAALAPGGGLGRPGGPHLLAVARGVESLRGVQPGVERGGHVSDHRSDVPRGDALLRA